MERVEQITRSVLNVRTIRQSENLHSAIVDEVLKDPPGDVGCKCNVNPSKI